MKLMEEASKAVLARTNRLVDAGVPPRKASELWRVVDEVGDPGRLLGRCATELAADIGRAADLEAVATDDRAEQLTLLRSSLGEHAAR